MRVVIKPAGLFILITVIAALSCLAFFGLPRIKTPAASAPATARPTTVATDDLYTNRAWELTTTDPEAAEMIENKESVPGVGEPVNVYRITTKKAVKDPWTVSFRMITPANIVKGETLRMTFRARSPESAPLTANFEQSSEPYTKSVTQNITTTTQWKPYTVEFKSVDNYAPEKSHTTFHCAFKTGTIEITDLHLHRAK